MKALALPMRALRRPALNPARRRARVQALQTAALIGGVMALVLLISRFFLMGQSIRLDETQSLLQVNRTVPEILEVVGRDVHVPLYHLLLHGWLETFGVTVASARAFSLALFLMSIPLFYTLARMVLSRPAALVTMAAYGLSPFMNWYANETRMYALLSLIAIVNQIFYLRLLRGRSGWVGYALTALAGTYTHYFFSFMLLTQGLFYLGTVAWKKWHRLWPMAGVAAFVVAGLLPWVTYVFLLGGNGNSRPRLPVPSAVDFFNVYSQFLFGFQTDAVNTVLVSAWPLLGLAAFIALGRRQKAPREVTYLAAAAFTPPMIAFVASHLVQPFFLSRYMTLALPAFFIALGWIFERFPKALARPLSVLALTGFVALSTAQYSSPLTPVKEDYRGVAAYLEDKTSPRDVVAVSAPFTIYPIQRYYEGEGELTTVPFWDRDQPGPVPAYDPATSHGQIDELARAHDKIYLVMSYDQGYESKIKEYCDTRLERLEDRTFSPGLKVYVYQSFDRAYR